MSRNKEHRPNGAAAEVGASVFFASGHEFSYIMHIYGYSLYIPYKFYTHIYIYMYVLKISHIFSSVCN